MDAEYVKNCAAISVSFRPEEIDDAIDVLKEFLVEAEEMQMHVPVFADGYFEKLAMQTTDVAIQFNFAYLEFGMNFLEKAFVLIPKEDSEVAEMGAKIRRLWNDVDPYFVRDSTLH